MAVSMQESRPYRKMATSCRTRPVTEKRIVWPRLDPVLPTAGKYRVTVLRRDLVEAAARPWRLGYPELHGSPHEFLLDPDLYPGWVALWDRWEEDAAASVYCMSVLEEVATGEVLGASVLAKFERNLQVEFSLVATLPDFRLKNLTAELRRFVIKIAAGTGAEYFATFCETWHDITQRWCLQGGWKIAGVFPGNFVRWNGDDQEYRGCTVHFHQFVRNARELVTRPEEWHLAPEVKKVWEVLDEATRASRLDKMSQNSPVSRPGTGPPASVSLPSRPRGLCRAPADRRKARACSGPARLPK
ncbi:MAG: hypothetical protein AUK55_04590 [Syntrophobacteraceae bacterium CG2_30_61_12]|nr:MAG: hypothetical protein AUK55_04590 [Syntrophobacteraceae bacterium CG2_30_61_12]PIU32190.1 MAG: hypothetical protein COT06_04025 [Syntrophobacteraceae bacterium CG07_land_8_20_14_0_80_61_8]